MPAKKTAALAIPDDAKKPEDHKPPAPAAAPAPPAPDRIQIVVRGVTLEVDAAVRDDFELLDELVGLDPRAATAADAARLLRRIMPDPADRKRVYDITRDPATGRPPTQDTGELIAEIFQALDPNS